MNACQTELTKPLQDDRIVINERCVLRQTDGCAVVFVKGEVVFSYDADDVAARRLAMIQLVESKVASKTAIAKAFGVTRMTIHRLVEKYRAHGVPALVPKKLGPKGPRITGGRREKVILRRKESGESNYQIAERLGLSEGSIRLVLKRVGYTEKRSVQTELCGASPVTAEDNEVPAEKPLRSEAAASAGDDSAASARATTGDTEVPVVHTFDRDPTERTMDRFLARQGLLEDAAPFYGLRNVVLTLLICFLRGINRPENLKRYVPSVLGQVLGLDRAPEMKTLRRKIRALALPERALSFARAQMKRHLSRLTDDLLWVYVDGHVSVYSGKQKIKKHHVTRLRISMPSVLDYWVNDANGDPLLVFSGRARQGMVSVLRETLAELRAAGECRVITLVFDREGWSPALFAELCEMEGVRFVTYRKASRGKKLPRLAASAFKEHKINSGGEAVSYDLADTAVYIDYGPRQQRKRLALRQVTRHTAATGKQTHVVTNDRETTAVELAHRMFSRWGQENFLKYMVQNRDFDGLLTYLMEDVDTEPMVVNPKRTELRKELNCQRLDLEKLTAAYGAEALRNRESSRPTMRGFKIANGRLGQKISRQQSRVEKLEARLKQVPARVPLAATLKGKSPKKVHAETRRLIHVFRMSAHRAESALRELFRPAYPRWRHESREMVRTFLNSSGDLEVKGGELRVTLQAQAAPHRTQVLAHLCAQLNTLNAKFPGSDLVFRFGVHGAESVTGSG
jgi:transposase